MSRFRQAVQLLISLLATAVFGWWAFRDTRWDELWSSLRSANYLWLVPSMALVVVVHLLRAWRWGFQLSALERVRFRHLNEATAVGNMLFLLLPLRLGEVARPMLIARRTGIRPPAAMASIVVERVVDGIALSTMLWVLLLWVPESAPMRAPVRWGANAMFAVFAGGFAVLLLALRNRERALGLVRATFGRISPGLAERVASVIETFVSAVQRLPGRAEIAWFLASTVAIWVLTALAMVVLSFAFGCGDSGGECASMQLNLYQGLVLLGVTVVATMIPAAPGMVGTYQAGVKLGLSLFLPAAVVGGAGMAYANVLWLSQTAVQLLIGLVFLPFSVGVRAALNRREPEAPTLPLAQ